MPKAGLRRRDFLKFAAVLGMTVPVAGAAPVPGPGLAFSKRLPVRVETDVFVAGGGPAGVAAAVTAARAGAKVFLAEAHTCFGGMSTAGRIPLFMTWSDGIRNLAAGFGARVRERLEKESHLTGQAAGMAAALSVPKNGEVRSVTAENLRSRLRKVGAYVPEVSA